jgi:cytochrome P450
VSDQPTPDWDPRDPSVLRDQRAAYDRMRESCPVARSDFLGWSIFRHEDILTILKQPELYSSVSRHPAIPNGMDPPEHTAYRHILEPYYEAEEMKRFEPECRRIAIEALEALPAGDEAECISSFVEPFAIQSLCAFLGWPRENWSVLRGWIHGNQRVAFSQDRQEGKELALALERYVKDELQGRRDRTAGSPDDITSRLMAIEVNSRQLSDDDIVSILRNWIAGHGTVVAALGLLLLYLAEHPDLQQHLRDRPSLLPAAIDEILRIDDPLVSNRRTTTRAVMIGGREIGPGEQLTLIWIAANRDRRAFDDSDQARLHRDERLNLVFGQGIHICLGAPLARLELRVALAELLARTRRIEPAGNELPTRHVYPSNGLETLRLRLVT